MLRLIRIIRVIRLLKLYKNIIITKKRIKLKKKLEEKQSLKDYDDSENMQSIELENNHVENKNNLKQNYFADENPDNISKFFL